MLAAGIVLTLLALALGASAQKDGQQEGISNPYTSTPVTLYMHVDGIQHFPINTQLPDDRFQDNPRYGPLSHTTSCLGTEENAQTWHTYYGYSTPGYVQYDHVEEGKPRYHKERGISYDVDLDTTSAMTIHWYMETHVTTSDPDPANPNVVPVVVPQVVAKATLRSGDAIGVGDASLNEGAIIAQGRTEPTTLAGPATASPEVTHHEVEGKHVYGFAIPMDFQGDTITRDDSYNIRIDVFIDNPQCDDPTFAGGDEYLMANSVRVHTSPGLRPRAELAVMNPLRIEYMHPQFIGDDLVIHTAMNSAWGNYDVNEGEGGITLEIKGPSPATRLVRAAFVQRHHDHHHHQEPVDATWVWPYKEDGAKDGVYTVSLSVTNDQETAKAVGEVRFQIGKAEGEALPPCPEDEPNAVNCARPDSDGSKKTPGPALALLVGLIAAAARRRR